MKDDFVEKVLVGAQVSRETQMALKLIAAKNNHSMAEEVRVAVDKHIARFEKEVKRTA